MKNYKQLAVRYLKMNKIRSMVTIFGVMVATCVLYVLLNMGWSAILNERKIEREKQDYEIVLLTETAEQIDTILKDSLIKSAQAGEYYDYDYNEPVVYKNALYINTVNPYRLSASLKHFKNQYGVEAYLNDYLAATYMQDGSGTDGNLMMIMILSALLFSFIFAIFAVGIVRSSIQMSTLEQIKDYGNLRCVGASKGELKKIVYLEGAILEIIGISFGVLFGSIVSWMIGYKIGWEAGFHVVPLIPILIAFLGDWYFAMEENCKVIVHLTPVSAIRGEYRIKKEKIKKRKQSIFGKLFGVEGDYAYKSIMRNPGRFYKTVWAMGLCIAAFMATAGCLTSIWKVKEEQIEEYQYYHVFFEAFPTPTKSFEEIQGTLPPMSLLERVGNLKGMTEAKRRYAARLVLADREAHFSHFNEEYLNATGLKEMHEMHENSIGSKYSSMDMYGQIYCYGYDDTDMQRLEKSLIEGTLEVSENGIVIVNGGEVSVDDGKHLVASEVNMEYTDYELGDTIEIVDMKKLQNLMDVKRNHLAKEYEVKKAKLEKEREEGEENKDYELLIGGLTSRYNYLEPRKKLLECYEKLVREGDVKAYTIEGIISEDLNHVDNMWEDEMNVSIILPLEKYFALTATDESMSTGMMYHFDKFPVEQYRNIYMEEMPEDGEMTWDHSYYPWIIESFESWEQVNYGVLLVVLFIVTMTTFNVINTTAGSLHIRRKELAQLRVIGVSKKRLMKIVILEGIIASIVANVIGVVLGSAISFGVFYMTLTLVFDIPYHFPFVATIFALLVSTGILCGAVYISLRGLKQDVAGDLATGGE